MTIANTLFSTELVESFGDPAWLQTRRKAAAEQATAMKWPTTEAEEWRYSRIDDIDPEELGPAAGSEANVDIPEAATRLKSMFSDAAGTIVSVNGTVRLVELSDTARAAGVQFGLQSEVGEQTPEVPTPDLPSALNSAFSTNPLSLVVPANAEIKAPFVVINYQTAEGATVLPSISVSAGVNSHSNMLVWSGSDDIAGYSIPRVHAEVADGATFHATEIQDLAEKFTQLGVTSGVIQKDATLGLMHIALGGDYARARFDCDLVGRGSRGDLVALYLGGGTQMHDIRTFQNHVGRDTTSNLVFKGAVADHSHSVYTGMIHVGKDARGTDASQTNRNLKLSEHAWAESVPNLEIENNEVKCAHASTVGPIDADEQFYLESRGVPPDIASRLVVAGFFNEVVSAIPQETVAAEIRDRIENELAVIS